MTDRDRLIELICKVECEGEESFLNCPERRNGNCRSIMKLEMCQVNAIADYLLANGVIALPREKGAVLNRNGEKCIANNWNIILTAFNEDNQVRLFDVKEAEQALKERGNNGQIHRARKTDRRITALTRTGRT